MDEHSQYSDGEPPRLSVHTVYERIKRSNSSLNRKSKKLLEDSIGRVLAVLKEEVASDDDDIGSFEGDFGGLEPPSEISVQVINLLQLSYRQKTS